MSEPLVTVRGMAEAFRRFQQAERELARLAGYRTKTPAMKSDADRWRDQRAAAEHYLRNGPARASNRALPLPEV